MTLAIHAQFDRFHNPIRRLKVLRVSAYACLQTCYSDFKERLPRPQRLPAENGAGFYSPTSSLSRSFFLFFAAQPAPGQPDTQKSSPPHSCSAVLNPSTLSFFSKELRQLFIPACFFSTSASTALFPVENGAPSRRSLHPCQHFFAPSPNLFFSPPSQLTSLCQSSPLHPLSHPLSSSSPQPLSTPLHFPHTTSSPQPLIPSHALRSQLPRLR